MFLTSRCLSLKWILIAASITVVYLIQCSSLFMSGSLCMYMACIWKLWAGVIRFASFYILWCRFCRRLLILPWNASPYSTSMEQNMVHLLLIWTTRLLPILHCEPVITVSPVMTAGSVKSTGGGSFSVHQVWVDGQTSERRCASSVCLSTIIILSVVELRMLCITSISNNLTY